MRKLVIILLLSLASLGVSAQRYLPGQKAIQLTTYAVDGFHFKNADKQAFAFGIAFSSYTTNGNRWVFGAEYLQKKYLYKETLLPLAQITAEGGYYFRFLSDPSKTVSFSLGTSATLGYESLNWGKEHLFDGAMIADKEKFLYGGTISLEMETFISDRLALLANVRERILFGSTVNKYHLQVGIGFKLIIN